MYNTNLNLDFITKNFRIWHIYFAKVTFFKNKNL